VPDSNNVQRSITPLPSYNRCDTLLHIPTQHKHNQYNYTRRTHTPTIPHLKKIIIEQLPPNVITAIPIHNDDDTKSIHHHFHGGTIYLLLVLLLLLHNPFLYYQRIGGSGWW